MIRRPLSIIAALLLATATTGCFGLFGGGEPEQSAVITVLNNVDPPREVTIQVRRTGSGENTIGTVAAGAERSLTYRADEMQGTYQLVARQPGGAAVLSREFTLFPDARVRWQLRTNSLTVSQDD